MLYYVASPDPEYQFNYGLHKIYKTHYEALEHSMEGWYIHAVSVTTYPVVTGGLMLGDCID